MEKNNIKSYIERKYKLYLVAIIVIMAFNCFYNLNNTPINSWDEARHGINAYEMLKNHNIVVNTYEYKNDYWNLKPPVSYWLIMINYKMFGFNNLSLRLYSVISGILTVFLVGWFTNKKHGKVASLISMLVLSTTPQYLVAHSVRTADADSLFVFFFTLSMISMLLVEENINYLYIAGISFALAFLTKSWHAGAIMAIGGLYLIITKKLFKLKIREIILFLISVLVPIICWMLERYSYDGMNFIIKMFTYDLLDRTSTALEGNTGGYLFYIKLLIQYYPAWLAVLFISASLFFIRKKKIKVNDYSIGITLWIGVTLLLFTIAKTKLKWYVIPIYPALAIVIGAQISELFKEKKVRLLMMILLSLSFIANEGIIGYTIIKPKTDEVQQVIKKLKANKEYNGVHGYTMVSTQRPKGIWDQNHLLAAELNSNIIPKDGGLEGFVKDNNKSILIMPKDSEVINKYNFKIITSSSDYYIVTK